MSARTLARLAGISALALACTGLAVPAFAASAGASDLPGAHVGVSPAGLGAQRAAVPAGRLAPAAPNVATTTTPTATYWVSNAMPHGDDTSCRQPGFATISAALTTAITGSLIHVCAGTYQEQLAVTKSVTLAASGDVTVLLPASPATDLTACDTTGGAQPNQDVVDICGAVSVAIHGFTVKGDWSSTVCNDSLYGVAVLGGASLTMTGSRVEDVGGNPLTDGCQGGVGIEVGLATTGTMASAGSATLSNDVVTTYQKNGITVDGAGSHAAISGLTVVGAGTTAAIAQNGIQVSDNAQATITNSFVSGDECSNAACGPTLTQATGVLLFDAGLTKVSSTTVSGCDLGVYNLEGYAWPYYTPPSPFTPVLDKFTAMGLNNRYENAYFDEGKSELATSRLTGAVRGMLVAQRSYQQTPAVATALHDTVTGAGAAAVLVTSDHTAGDHPVNVHVTSSSFDTSNAKGIDNTSTSVVVGTSDWWGAATGPSDWGFGTGSSVSPDVNFFPWATTAAETNMEACTTGNNQSSSGTDVVLCANASGNAYLANTGSGNVLLIGNHSGNDQLVGSATGHTWIIGGTLGSNVINGNTGAGFIQLRGDPHDVLVATTNDTVART